MREKLIELRGDKTVTEVAKDVGITRQMLSAIESGSRTPSLEVAKKIASYYSSTIDEIFFEVKCNWTLLFVWKTIHRKPWREVRGMRESQIKHVIEVYEAEKANELIQDGWEILNVFPHPKGFVIILFKQ